MQMAHAMELLVVMGAHPHLFDGEDVRRTFRYACEHEGAKSTVLKRRWQCLQTRCRSWGYRSGKGARRLFRVEAGRPPAECRGPRRGAGHCAGDLVGGAGDLGAAKCRVGGAGDLVAAGDRVGAGKCRVGSAGDRGRAGKCGRPRRRRRARRSTVVSRRPRREEHQHGVLVL